MPRIRIHHSSPISRRDFLRVSAVAAAGVAIKPAAAAQQPPPKHEVTQTSVLSLDSENYHGWPTLARGGDGRLWVVCSGGRERHVCPFGRVDLYVSSDGGRTWGWPRTLLDGDIDDRDAGVLVTGKGTILVTTFTSLAYEAGLESGEKGGTWPAARLKKWRAAHNRQDARQRRELLGQWMIRSTDGGRTWSPPYPTLVNSPHGPVELADGRLLYAGKELWTGEKRIGVCESLDDGQTWKWLAGIPTRKGDLGTDYHELHAVQAPSGRLIVQIRNENMQDDNHTLQSESEDGGKTWSVPHLIGVWGTPSHLLRLKSGNLLMTYGHRRAPLGNQARLSRDEGRTWSEPMVISGDGITGDLGYPSTAQLEDGSLISVWYEVMKGSAAAVLRQARWKLEE